MLVAQRWSRRDRDGRPPSPSRASSRARSGSDSFTINDPTPAAFDLVVEAAGSTGSDRDRRGGRAARRHGAPARTAAERLDASLCLPTCSSTTTSALRRELRLHLGRLGARRRTAQRAAAIAPGRLVTHRFPLDAYAQAFAALGAADGARGQGHARGGRWLRSRSSGSRRSTVTARSRSTRSTSRSATASSSCSSGRPAAARRARCAWSRASRRSRAASVRIGGRVVNDLLPKDRDIAMVFQNYALYPHMSVYDNMAFGLRHRRVPKAAIDERVTRGAHARPARTSSRRSRARSRAASASAWRWGGRSCASRRPS